MSKWNGYVMGFDKEGKAMLYSAHSMIDAILTTHFDDREEAAIRRELVGFGDHSRQVTRRWSTWRANRVRVHAD
jgi:hypothetical protein